MFFLIFFVQLRTSHEQLILWPQHVRLQFTFRYPYHNCPHSRIHRHIHTIFEHSDTHKHANDKPNNLVLNQCVPLMQVSFHIKCQLSSSRSWFSTFQLSKHRNHRNREFHTTKTPVKNWSNPIVITTEYTKTLFFRKLLNNWLKVFTQYPWVKQKP